MQKKRVAIVGSGCSGLGALWALKSQDYDVHLYEAQNRLGGHTNTVVFREGDHKTMVDSGFIVMNTATYREYVPGGAPTKDLLPSSKPHCLPQGARYIDRRHRYVVWRISGQWTV